MKRNTLGINVDVSPGSDIAAACEDAVDLSRRLGIAVWFKFNGVKCLARPDDYPQDIEIAWRNELKSNKNYKIAAANTRYYGDARQGDRNAGTSGNK